MRRAILLILATVLLMTAALGRTEDRAAGAHAVHVKMANLDNGDRIFADQLAFTYTDADADGDGVLDSADNCPSEAGPASNNGCPVLQSEPYPGIRFYKMVGNSEWDTTISSGARVDNLYTTYMKSAYHDKDDSVDYAVRTKLEWEQTLVNESTVPTHAQMRDPNWSGYIWNNPSNPNYLDVTELDRMLEANCVRDGKCKIAINLGLSATGGTNAPQFMVDRGLAWVGAGPTDNNTRVKYYRPEARQYAEEFTLAVLERFSDPNIGSVMINEYFPGAIKPADFTHSGYISGYETYLENVVASAPNDPSGNRVTIYQANPVIRDGLLDASDFKRLMVGIADSNAQMFEEPARQESLRAALRVNGVNQVPMQAPLDSVPFNKSRHTIYPTGFPNPWNYSGSVRMDVPQIAWYYGRCGPDPMDQQFISKPGRATVGFPNQPITGFIGAMDQFGPGGGYHSSNCSPSTDDWGGVPFAQ